MNKSLKSLILKLWIIQCGLSAIAITGFWLVDKIIGYSIACGFFIFWVPNAYFALKVFRLNKLSNSEEYREHIGSWMLADFYRGEVHKFVLTAVSFAAVFATVNPLNAPALFLTYIVLMFVQWGVLSRWQ